MLRVYSCEPRHGAHSCKAVIITAEGVAEWATRGGGRLRGLARGAGFPYAPVPQPSPSCADISLGRYLLLPFPSPLAIAMRTRWEAWFCWT
jgi:hypothetical protein